MPDEQLAESLIATAKKLLPEDEAAISQADLRRAVSTAYFAVFHALAKASANALVGHEREKRPNRAWIEVYRGLSHGSSKDACKKAGPIGFPEEIEGFSDIFVQLQTARKRVDYDPTCKVVTVDARRWVASAEVSIQKLETADTNSKVAFATWVLITSPGAHQARTAVKENIGPNLGPPT